MGKHAKRALAIAVLICFLIGFASSQEGQAAPENTAAKQGEASQGETSQEEQPQAPAQRGEPVFPEENPNVIFVEGEDAVSTSFNREPILNYSCSGYRTLQLNRTHEVQWGSVFYAEFVFYVEEPGIYEFWYGGTPPGPQDEQFPSYASPFRYVIDDQEPLPGYREDVNIAEQYAPSYYWCLVDEVELTPGRHTIRFEVEEKRRFDSRYYFYLDCFFLVRQEGGQRKIGEPVPAVFPKNLADRSMDYPFRDIEDYLILIRENPKDLRSYIELALIYTLLGDNLSAIKYLKRAGSLDPDNVDFMLLQAKNRIWKGDVSEGLKIYQDLLIKDPNRLENWMEAGKVAAWTGSYDKSIVFFTGGLANFPDNLDLIVNAGLTYLWSGEEKAAQDRFDRAREIVGEDFALWLSLARTFEVNGYPERAIDVYKETIRRFPNHLEAYFLLEETYYDNAKRKEAAQIRELTEKTFLTSERLSRYLDIFHEKQGLKQAVIDDYVEKIREEPDNLALREVLAQTYFWNGLRSEAIDEYLNILVNHAFLALKEMDDRALDFFEMMDRSYVFLNFAKYFPDRVKEFRSKMSDGLTSFRSAQQALESFQQRVNAAKEKGEELPQPQGEDPQDVLNRENENLQMLLGQARSMADIYREKIDLYEQEVRNLDRFRETEAAEDETFRSIIKTNRWAWDRNVFMQELGEVESHGVQLASYVSGRLLQFEENLTAAERALAGLMESDTMLVEYRYANFQTLHWAGKAEEARAILEESQTQLADRYPYLKGLRDLMRGMSAVAEARPVRTDTPEEAIETILDELDQISGEATVKARDMQVDLDEMHALLSDMLLRTVYFLQEATYLIRRELGDYYIAEKKLPAAIDQFRQVLAVDPWDTASIFRLGNVYEQRGDWFQAMQSYARVYSEDPLYENVSYRYNELARQHADSVHLIGESFVDTQRVQFHMEAGFVNPLNTVLGWSLRYENDLVRAYKTYDPDEPYAYLVHGFYLGLPIDLYFMNLEIHPRAGVNIWTELFEQDDAASASAALLPLQPFAYVGYTRVAPVFLLEATLNLGDYVYFDLGGRFGRNEDTFAPGRAELYDITAEFSAAVDFSFIDVWPFKYSASRTYGRADFIIDETDGNIIWEVGEELTLGIIKVNKPYIALSLPIRGLFQDSINTQDFQYYAPQEILVVDGGPSFEMWFEMGETNALGFAVQGFGGVQIEKLLSTSITRVTMDFSGSVEFTHGAGTFSLGAQFGTSYRPDLSGDEAWDYWSFAGRLGYSTTLPRLLTE